MASKKPDAFRISALAALPESIRNLPTLEYRRRTARTLEESISDVEYGVETNQDLSKRFRNRMKK